MQRSTILAALVLASLSAQSALAQEKLAWKFKEGDKFYIEEKATVKQTTKVLGNEEYKEEVQTNLVSFQVLKKTDDAVVLVQTIEEMKTELIKGKDDPQAAATLEKMRGAKFTITLNNKGEITKFEGYDAFITKLSDGDANVEKVLRAVLPPDTFKKMAAQSFSMLPPKAVKKGDTWDRETNISMGPMGSLKAKHTFKYEGTEKDLDIITNAAKLEYVAPKGDGGGLPFKILKGNMMAEKSAGKTLFDRKLGRPVQDNTTIVLKGSMTMEILGMELDVDIHLNQTSVTRVFTKKTSEKK
jgi:hypothetical protein